MMRITCNASARSLLRLVIAATLVVVTSGSLAAQRTGTIQGRIVEAGTQRPLQGGQVTLVGTNRGVLTNATGEFLIPGVPAGEHRVRVQYLGYATSELTVTVQPDQSVRADFRLTQSAVALDAIVVTGTAGATSRRTLGNSITSVDAAAITERTAITNLTELLQAKSPGVQLLTNSGTLGAATEIRIRGAGSLTNTRPVVFIDGVRYNTDDLGSFTPSGAGATSFSGQTTSAFNFINPNDIESIEVVKGPAAATLYGAEAANGVIQIITKKGRRGEQSTRWDIRTEYGENDWAINIPDNYTTCTAALIAEMDAGGNPVWPGCQGVSAGTVLRDNPLRRDPVALRTGSVLRSSVSARGGGERYSFYFAGDLTNEDGIFHNNFSDRKSVRANFTINPNEWLDVFVTSAYARGDLRLPVGDEAAQGMLLSALRGRPGRVTVNPLNSGWATTRAEQANAYNNTTRSDRLTLGTTIGAAPISWFRNRLTLGMDFTSSLAQVLSPPGSVDADYAGFVSQGLVAQRVPRNYTYTIDYSGNIDRVLFQDVTSTTSFGMQAVSRRAETISATGTGLGAPDITLISAAATTVGGNTFSEQKSFGMFLQEQVGWKNRLFVTGAVRADDNSSFGDSFDWLYYPKAQVAWVVSEEPFVEDLLQPFRIDNLKLRAAWGQAGQAPAPFSATQIYTVDRAVRPDGSVVSALRPSSYGNPGLKAERGSELELGFDLGLLRDRVGIDFTYYSKQMRDVIISLGAAGSSGFAGTFYGGTSAILTNLGETRNTGIEVALSANPVMTERILWTANLSLSTNSNTLVRFGDNRPSLAVGGQSYGAVQVHREGVPLGGYWYRVPLRDASGAPVVYTHTNNVRYLVTTDTAVYIGTPTPTREISLSNTFTVMRNLRLFVLLDHKGGHHLFNYREYNRCAQNANCPRRHDPALMSNADSVIWRSTTSIPKASADAGNIAGAQAPLGAWIEKADFVKLRDLSLSYTVPSDWVRRFGASSATFTVAGRNLALWSDYSGMDPEVNGYGNRSFARFDGFPVPNLRRWSTAVNLSF
jgi:TonB-dependent starch-binding outer membrane protein SusC